MGKRQRKRERNRSIIVWGPPGIIVDDPAPTPAEWEHSEFARIEAERDLHALRVATLPLRWGRVFIQLVVVGFLVAVFIVALRHRYGW